MINYNRWSYGNYNLVSPIPSDNVPRWSNGGILLLYEAESSTNITITHITSVLNVSINNHNYLIDTVINHISKSISFTVNTHSIVTIEDVLITHTNSNLTFICGIHSVIIDTIHNHAINNITLSTNSHQVNIDNVIIHTALVIALETKTHTALIDIIINHNSSSFNFTTNNHTVLSDIIIQHNFSSFIYTVGSHIVIIDKIITHSTTNLNFIPNTHIITKDVIILHELSILQITPNIHSLTNDIIIFHVNKLINFVSQSHQYITDLIISHTTSNIILSSQLHSVSADIIFNHSNSNITFTTGTHTVITSNVILHNTNSIIYSVNTHIISVDIIIPHTTKSIVFTTGTHLFSSDTIISHNTSQINFTVGSHTIINDIIIGHSSKLLNFTTNTHILSIDVINTHVMNTIQFTPNMHNYILGNVILHNSNNITFTPNYHSYIISVIISHISKTIEFLTNTHLYSSDTLINHSTNAITYTPGTHTIILDVILSHSTKNIQYTSNTHLYAIDFIQVHTSKNIVFNIGSHLIITDFSIQHYVQQIILTPNTHSIVVDVIYSHSTSLINYIVSEHNVLIDTIFNHTTSSLVLTSQTHEVDIPTVYLHSASILTFTPNSHNILVDVSIVHANSSLSFTPNNHIIAVDITIFHTTNSINYFTDIHTIHHTLGIKKSLENRYTLDNLVGSEITPEVMQSLVTEGRITFPLKNTQTSAVSQPEDQPDIDSKTTAEGNIDEYINSVKENEDMIKMLEDMRDDMLSKMKIPPASNSVAEAAKQLGSPDGTITLDIFNIAQTILDIIQQIQTGNDPVIGAITGNGTITADFIKCSEVTQAIADNWKIGKDAVNQTSDELHNENSMRSVSEAKESFAKKMKNMYLYIRDMLWWNLIWARLVIFFIELLEKVVAIPIDTPFLFLRFFKKLTPDNYQKYGPIHKMLNKLKILLLCRVPSSAFKEYKPDEDIQVWYPTGKTGKFVYLRELCSQETSSAECPPGQSPWPDESNTQGTYDGSDANKKLASIKNIISVNFSENSQNCIPTNFISDLFKESKIEGPGMSPDCAEAAKKIIDAVQDDALHFGEYQGINIEPETIITGIITPKSVKSGTFTDIGSVVISNNKQSAKFGTSSGLTESVIADSGKKSRKQEEEFDFFDTRSTNENNDGVASTMQTAILTGTGSNWNSTYYELNSVTIDGNDNMPVFPLDITENLADTILYINGVSYELDSWENANGSTTIIRTGNNGFSISYVTGGSYIKIKWNNNESNDGFDINDNDSIILRFWVD